MQQVRRTPGIFPKAASWIENSRSPVTHTVSVCFIQTHKHVCSRNFENAISARLPVPFFVVLSSAGDEVNVKRRRLSGAAGSPPCLLPPPLEGGRGGGAGRGASGPLCAHCACAPSLASGLRSAGSACGQAGPWPSEPCLGCRLRQDPPSVWLTGFPQSEEGAPVPRAPGTIRASPVTARRGHRPSDPSPPSSPRPAPLCALRTQRRIYATDGPRLVPCLGCRSGGKHRTSRLSCSGSG